METAEELELLEERLLNGAVRKNAAAVAELLAEDFREFGSSGRVFTKAEIIAELQAESPRALTLTEFAAKELAEGLVLVTYRSRREADGIVVEALRSSVWRMEGARWRMVFHQGTRVGESR